MQRRDVLRLLTSAAAVSAMPAELLQALQEARAEVGPGVGLRTLNAHQNATLTTLTERIIPETSTPGARSTRVNEFIDLLLTEWYDKPDVDRFLQGIAECDAASQRRFQKTFLQCSPDQQVALMKDWDSQAMDYVGMAKQAQQQKATPPLPTFFYTVKRLTLVGYYTSEAGFTKELRATIIPLKHAGCAPLAEARS